MSKNIRRQQQKLQFALEPFETSSWVDPTTDNHFVKIVEWDDTTNLKKGVILKVPSGFLFDVSEGAQYPVVTLERKE